MSTERKSVCVFGILDLFLFFICLLLVFLFFLCVFFGGRGCFVLSCRCCTYIYDGLLGLSSFCFCFCFGFGDD